MKKNNTLAASFQHAFAGIAACIRQERNMKIHLAAAAAVTAGGLWLHISKAEWLVCLVFFGLVMALELMNTAIEAVVDLVCPQEHPKAKLAKDTAAGAVLVAAIFAAVAGVVIFGPKVLTLFL